MGYDRLDAGDRETRLAVTARTRRGRSVPLPEGLAPRGTEPGGYAYAILGAGCAGLSLCHYLLERGVGEATLRLGRGAGPGGYASAILGAGCAGLSLCHYLLERGVEEPILILDRKEAFADDRTWCFWDVEETPFSGRTVRRWSSWAVCAEGREIVHTSGRYPYLCLTGADFYEDALEKISARGNVTVRLGEDVIFLKELDDGALVVTSSGSYLAGRVFDGRGLPPDSAVLQEARGKGTWISQQPLRHRPLP